nr:reverse transcriptase [Tanacetum cinerariifolium]
MDDASIPDRIDRGFANGSLLHTFPHHTLTHYPLIGNDHAPLLYRSGPELIRQKRFFSFESLWTLENSCEETIRTFWRNGRSIDCIDSLEENLSVCANGLRCWSRDFFGNNRRIIEHISTERRNIQALPPSAENCARQRFLKQKLEKHGSRRKCIGIRDLELIGLNMGTKTQDSVINQQFIAARKIELRCLKMVTVLGRGSKACVESVVSNNINSSLESPVTNCEIHKAVKELRALKAPGNDGFPGLFFQRYWHIIGDSVIMAVK